MNATQPTIEWEHLRQDVLRFSRIQLMNNDIAEDITQETMLAAYQHQAQFQGHSALKTWVFSILKNKIIDYFRQQQRKTQVFAETNSEALLDDAFEHQFDESGHWQAEANNDEWCNPEKAMINQEFQDILKMCLYQLPENTARVFMMKEILGLATQEIMQQCGISNSHFHVMMHRARESLRQCLQIKWFQNV